MGEVTQIKQQDARKYEGKQSQESWLSTAVGEDCVYQTRAIPRISTRYIYAQPESEKLLGYISEQW
jgi:hypothetical protein